MMMKAMTMMIVTAMMIVTTTILLSSFFAMAIPLLTGLRNNMRLERIRWQGWFMSGLDVSSSWKHSAWDMVTVRIIAT
ncbi:MAG: hypothetical protein J3Q66DRAFT_330793 [Benniella sp.]|nr:MAG: hypothetical protein J3Q66DRAFT_330793 [Benniella sp.]